MTENIQSITVLGRRWQDSSGSTYFTADVLVDGCKVVQLDRSYGYGEQYLEEAFKWLDANGYTARDRHDGRPAEPPWRYCERTGIKLYARAANVARRKDL
jgi:hypothetical protein